MLAANTDRDRAIDVLKASFAEGRLTKAEYDDRTARVHAARTYGELWMLVADLPAGPLGGPAHYPGAGLWPVTRPHTNAKTTRPATNAMVLAALAIGLIVAIITGLVIATSASGPSTVSVAHPVPGGLSQDG